MALRREPVKVSCDGQSKLPRSVPDLAVDYESIESFLNSVVREYEKGIGSATPAEIDAVDIVQPPQLRSFLDEETFKNNITMHFHVIVEVLLASELRPPREEKSAEGPGEEQSGPHTPDERRLAGTAR
jgi:hypothetical protein